MLILCKIDIPEDIHFSKVNVDNRLSDLNLLEQHFDIFYSKYLHKTSISYINEIFNRNLIMIIVNTIHIHSINIWSFFFSLRAVCVYCSTPKKRLNCLHTKFNGNLCIDKYIYINALWLTLSYIFLSIWWLNWKKGCCKMLIKYLKACF